jgi:hypothetical protein
MNGVDVMQKGRGRLASIFLALAIAGASSVLSDRKSVV